MEISISMFMFFVFLGISAVSPLPLVSAIIGGSLSVMLILWDFTNKWLSYSIFLIFLGGMMVVFLYASILSSNEKLVFKTNPLSLLVVVFGSMLLSMWPSLHFNEEVAVSKLYSPTFYSAMVFLVLYLLMVLFLIVKLSEPLKGSLTKKF